MDSTRSDRARAPLLIIQLLLAAGLITAITLAVIEAQRTPAATPTPAATGLVGPPAVPSEAVALASPTAEIPPSPVPTNTQVPTETPIPTATAFRETITLTGQGDAVVYPQKWIGPALVRINHDGGGPLLIWTQDNNAERVELLAQADGGYHGASFIDFVGSQRTLRFEVRTNGHWQIDVMPLTLAPHQNVPGGFRGSGDEGIVLQGALPDLMTVDASSASGAFVIWAYGNGRTQVLTTNAPYTGTLALPRDTTALAIKSSGAWTLEISTR
jgi:hypothetical protein